MGGAWGNEKVIVNGRRQAEQQTSRNLGSGFRRSDPSQLDWADIEALLKACGAKLTQGRGSRVRVALMKVRAIFHRPHPQKETDKGAVRSMRRFLSEAGVTP